MSGDERIVIGVTTTIKVSRRNWEQYQMGTLSSRDLVDYGTIQTFSALELDTSKEEQRVLHNG